jgi:Glycosyltransferase
LSENVRYFLEVAGEKDCLVIAGGNPDYQIVHPRVFYAGQLDWKSLISLYKRSSHFIHLSWLDHCPNVVIDARAAGCHIICSSSGGTSEIAGTKSTIIKEEEWDLTPLKLYSPPEIDFSNFYSQDFSSEIDMHTVSEEYIKVLKEVSL